MRTDRRLHSRTRLLVIGALAAAVLLFLAHMAGAWQGNDLHVSRIDIPAPAASEYAVPAGALFVSPDGDDRADGTEASPLRTLAAAVDRAEPGATIVMREGTYRETVGFVGTRITIQPYPSEEVWVKGSLVIDDWQRSADGWEHVGWVPDICRDCYIDDIVDPDYPLAGKPDMVFVDGQPLTQVGSRSEVVGGAFYIDVDTPAVVIGSDPEGREVEVAAFDHLLQLDGDSAAGSVIRGIGIAQYASRQDYGVRASLVIVNAPDVTIENVTFAWGASAGLGVFQPNVIVTDSWFGYHGLVGLAANRADDLTMTGNVFINNNAKRFAIETGDSIGAAGTKMTRTKRALIADNVFSDNHATGWWCDLGCSDATVIRNISTGNVKHGFYYEVSSRALFASNVAANNGKSGLKLSSSDGVRVYHNTFADNDFGVSIYNDPRDPDFDWYSEEQGFSWVTSETNLVNNYFAKQGTVRPVITSADYKPETAGNPPFVERSDGNAYLRAEPTEEDVEVNLVELALGDGRMGYYSTLDELRRDTGFEEQGIEAPMDETPFVDAGDGDYRLCDDAPGVRAGLPIPDEVVDVLGVEPDDHPDIGVLPR